MWPFKRKKKNLTELLNQEVLEAEGIVAEKWLIYRRLEFPDDVPLSDQIFHFMDPALEGLLKAKPALALCLNDLILLIFANGIAKTGTHHALEIQDALGIPRDDDH